MFSPSSLLLVHLVGLAIGLGAATAKLVLLFQCRADGAFVPTYLAVVRPITRQIILGLVLLLLSGIGSFPAGPLRHGRSDSPSSVQISASCGARHQSVSALSRCDRLHDAQAELARVSSSDSA